MGGPPNAQVIEANCRDTSFMATENSPIGCDISKKRVIEKAIETTSEYIYSLKYRREVPLSMVECNTLYNMCRRIRTRPRPTRKDLLKIIATQMDDLCLAYMSSMTGIIHPESHFSYWAMRAYLHDVRRDFWEQVDRKFAEEVSARVSNYFAKAHGLVGLGAADAVAYLTLCLTFFHSLAIFKNVELGKQGAIETLRQGLSPLPIPQKIPGSVLKELLDIRNALISWGADANELLSVSPLLHLFQPGSWYALRPF